MSLAQDYFPITSNSEYIYEGLGNEFASFTNFTDYTTNNKEQLRTNNGGTEIVRVYEYTTEGVKLVFSQGETYYRENFLNKTPNKNEYIILNPISVGNTWTLPDGGIRTITHINISIQTPYINIPSAIEITTINGQNKTIDYYVEGIGLIKTNFYSNNTFLVSSSLKEIRNSTPLTQTIRFFYPDNNTTNAWYVDKNINFFTNDLTKVKFQNEFKNPPNCFAPCIGPNTTINYLYYNATDDMVHVDFSANFVSDLNAGSSYELLSLLSITNAIGRYYNKNKVYITLAGNPYSSGHIEKQPGEPFLTNFSNINEYTGYSCTTKFYYTVKEGDTLSEIAYSFGTTYQELAAINNIPNPDLIYDGQVLLIYFNGTYIVRDGDTLSEIAEMFGTTYQELARINNIPDPDVIYVGQVLVIA
ncbi:LysM peptidoglycan-binding domain-containing protein [Clostridium cibarium]|nr:LysM domain-containing protein [Clostridium cibarium]